MESIITQTLVSVQGEGFGVGRPILLIRFGGCNFCCSFCDSSWTNLPIDCGLFAFQTSNTPFKITQKNIDFYIKYIQQKFLDKYNIRTVLFTGGETFQNIDFMTNFIEICNDMDYFDIYEIETNGSLLQKNIDFIDRYKKYIQLNISPKQTEYKEVYDFQFKSILNYLDDHFKNKKQQNLSNSFLKFVYAKFLESDILSFIKKFKPKIPIYMSSLTPQNGSKNFLETYRKNCLDTLEFCLLSGYKYSPREHVFLFGDNREEFASLKE